MDEEERKGEQELARIIKIFLEHCGEWLSVRDVAWMLTRKEDEATLRRIRRKLDMLCKERVLVSKKTRLKLYRLDLRYSPEDYHAALEHSKRVVLDFLSIMGEYPNHIKEALRQELKSVIRGRPLKGVRLLCPETGPREEKERSRTPKQLSLYEECIGILMEVFECDGYLIAVLALPVLIEEDSGLRLRIKESIGHLVGILRTERGYKVRVIE